MSDTMYLWEKVPGLCEEIPEIHYYKPKFIRTDMAVIIFPGGGYESRAEHEGEKYAQILSENGIHAFVVDYRVAPHHFPLPLLDARRAVRYVRAYSKKYGINCERIAVMGSSAGGHLVALLSTFNFKIESEKTDFIDEVDYIPNAQILCYPVISPPSSGVGHIGSYYNLIGKEDKSLENKLDPCINVSCHTPPAFIWHASDDAVVNVINTYKYCTALRNANISTELHVFPKGGHGCGLAEKEPHTAQWFNLLLNWFEYKKWLTIEQ